MKNNFFRLDIYSAPTIDFIDSNVRKGGPGYYASLALYMIGAHYEIYMPIEDKSINRYLSPLSDEPVYMNGYTLLFVIKEGFQRNMSLLNDAKKLPILSYSEYALISPLYRELQSYDIVRVSLSHKLSLIDLQGFTRIRLRDKNIVNNANIILYIINLLRTPNNIIKISIDDIEYDASALDEIITNSLRNNVPLILTLGRHGVILFDRDECSHVYPLITSNVSIGAGDMLSTITLYAIHTGSPLSEAVVKAVASTACILKQLEKGTRAHGACEEAFTRADLFTAKTQTLCSKCCLKHLSITLG